MAYEKLNFTAGQVLKADHLNHMEEGIANAAMANAAMECVTFDFSTLNNEDNSIQCDKTWEEIIFAIFAGKQLYARVVATIENVDVAATEITVMSPLTYCFDTTTTTISFSGVIYMNDQIMLISIYGSGSWTVAFTFA